VATVAQWVQGARPRTLPNAVAPVLVGTGGALGAGAVRPGHALLALLVAVGMVIGVNYANDYSDGTRGTDDYRVGPLRLVGSGAATPAAVRGMAVTWLAVAALAGLLLLALTGHWWLLVVGVACVLGAWFYTGGNHPYGYLGLGEVAVFVFFGPVAVLGTAYVQAGPPGSLTVLGAFGVGMLSCSVLVANNLRDIDTDTRVGKRTLAVLLGDAGTRRLYAALLLSPLRRVRCGVTGRELIAVLGDTALVMLAWSLGTAIGLASPLFLG
jgi:1,4-dihydroxy-2-naphthoate octaprenyltransferase